MALIKFVRWGFVNLPKNKLMEHSVNVGVKLKIFVLNFIKYEMQANRNCIKAAKA